MASRKRRKSSNAADTDVNAQILAVLKEGALSTKQLALELGVAHATIYRRCRRLEERGLLKSKLAVGRGPMYCVDEDKVVDRSTYERCKEEEHDLRPIDKNERIWSLP